MPIEINTSGVPAEKQSDPRFLTLRAQLQAALNNPKWRAAFCIHEAGHKIYMSRIGITKFEFFGPRIIYDESRNDFDGFPASVKAEPVPITGNGFDFDAWLLKLALTQAAGGVFARTLTAAPDDGDEGDWEKFQACRAKT